MHLAMCKAFFGDVVGFPAKLQDVAGFRAPEYGGEGLRGLSILRSVGSGVPLPCVPHPVKENSRLQAQAANALQDMTRP